ncbi:hypothetical protein COOONC_23076 [Cooperia oncophora]
MRYSYQEMAENSNFSSSADEKPSSAEKPQTLLISADCDEARSSTSSGPSRARVMELERLVSSIPPRRSRNAPTPSEDDELTSNTVDNSLLESMAYRPCFCPLYAPCIGRCHRLFRYW